MRIDKGGYSKSTENSQFPSSWPVNSYGSSRVQHQEIYFLSLWGSDNLIFGFVSTTIRGAYNYLHFRILQIL